MEENAVTTVSLEDNAEIVGLGQPAADTPQEPPPVEAQTPEEPEPEGTITIPQGKVVPLGAVQAERGKRKEAEKQLNALQAELQALKPKAERYDEAAQYLQQAQPIIEAIRNRPDLVAQAKNPPKQEQPKGPLTDEQALATAKALDLFKADGAHDVDRAQEIAKVFAGVSAQQAQAAVAPFHQQTVMQQSMANRNYILSLKDPAGNALVDPQELDKVWRDVPPDMTARPEVANVLYLTALGLQTQSGKTPKQPLSPPLVTESLGGSKPGPETLSHVDEAFLRASSMDKKTFVATRERWKPGVSNSLED